MCEYLLLRSRGSGVPVPVYLLFLVHFALFSYHFICFIASNCLQISWVTDLLEGVLSYNPLVHKSAFLAFDHFLIEPPPSLQHCFAGRARSSLAIGGGEELRPDDSALLELPDSVCCVTDLDSLSAGTTSRLRPFILPRCEVG